MALYVTRPRRDEVQIGRGLLSADTQCGHLFVTVRHQLDDATSNYIKVICPIPTPFVYEVISLRKWPSSYDWHQCLSPLHSSRYRTRQGLCLGSAALRLETSSVPWEQELLLI